MTRANDAILTEEELKERLGIDTWNQLTLAHQRELVQLAPRVSEQVLVEIVRQTPHFVELLKTLVEGVLKRARLKAEESAATKEVLESVIKSLDRLLQKDNLNSEDYRYIVGQMMEVVKTMERIEMGRQDTEKRKWDTLLAVGKTVGGVALAVLLVLLGERNSGDREV